MTSTSRLLGAVLACALGACNRGDPPAPPAPAPAAPAPVVDEAPLALRPLADGLEPSAELASAMKAVQALPGADRWVELGRAWVRTARLNQQESLYARVQDAAERALALKPGHRQALHLMGMVHRVGHRYADVQKVARELVAGDARDDTAWALLADAAVALDDMATAEKAIDTLLELRPALPAFSRAAWLRWLHGDADGAAEMWGEAVRASGHQDPEPRAWVLSELGHLEWHRNQLDAAERYYGLALQAMPKHAGALFGRGRVALARGDAAAAVQHLAASNAIRPSEVTAEWHAIALRAAGRDGADAIEKQLAAAGEFDDPRSIALYLSHRKMNPKRAVERARADFAQRQDIYAHDALGFALFRAGDLDGAARHLDRATRLGTPDAMLLAHRGLLDAARGRNDDARKALTAARALNPHVHPALMAEVEATLTGLPGDAP